jgi:hypothetical protein
MMLGLIEKIDPRDVMCLVGLAFLGTGLWWLEPWISFVAVGSILVALSILPDILVLKAKKRR